MKRKIFGLPAWLAAALILVVVLGVISGNRANNLIHFLTLAAVICYAYYTYVIAKDAWTPSASFVLVPIEKKGHRFAFLIKNHSKVSLQCWCKLNASVYGKPAQLESPHNDKDFYGGKTAFDVQPFGVANGVFDISDIVKSAGYTVEELERDASSQNVRSQLYLNIEFWYNPVGTTDEVKNPKQPHYFDFRNKMMITDF